MSIGRICVCVLGLWGTACGGASRSNGADEAAGTSNSIPVDTEVGGSSKVSEVGGRPSVPEVVTTIEDMGLEQLAESDGNMVAIGNSSTTSWAGDDLRDSERGPAVVYASTAGAAWHEVLRDTSAWFTSVAAGNGHFAVVGRREVEGAFLYVSDDTEVWAEAALPNQWVDTVVFGNGTFVARDQHGEIDQLQGHVYVSSDARAWQESSIHDFKTLDFAAGRFVGTNGKWVAVSTDGRDWASVGYSGNPIADVATVGDKFVAVTYYDCCFGERGYDYRLAVSADGLTWTERAIAGDAPVAVWSAAAGCIGVTLNSADLWLESGASCATANYSLSRAGSVLIVKDRAFGIHTDDHLASSIVTSTDAVSWTTLLE